MKSLKMLLRFAIVGGLILLPSLQRQGQLGLWASALGQEAAQIGAGHAAREPGAAGPDHQRR